MVRLVDIAKELNLDVSVVSRALNPNPDRHAVVKKETLECIRQTAKRLGYRPNRQASFLKKGGDATLLCYLPGFANRLSADLMFGISEAAAEEGFPLTFFNGFKAESFIDFLERALDMKHSGLLTYPPILMNDEVRTAFERYLKSGGQVLMLNEASTPIANPLPGHYSNLVRMDVDDAYGVSLAAAHLVERGCRHIRYLGPNYPIRREGLQKSAARFGADCAPLDWDELDALRKKNEPVGIFAIRDADIFIIVVRLATEGYEIGKQVYLVGFDDMDQCLWLRPSLSSIHQPTREEGRRAVKKLINMIFGKTERDETIKPYLMVRESTGGHRPDPGDSSTEEIIY